MNNKFKIENRYIGNDFPPVVIAEIGINHNGLLDLAIHLAENAIDCLLYTSPSPRDQA